MNKQFEEATIILKNATIPETNTVMFTVTTRGYMLYTLNMLKSVRTWGLDKKIVIACLDKKSEAYFKKEGYNVYPMGSSPNTSPAVNLGGFYAYNSCKYDDVCYLKLMLIYEIIQVYKKDVLLVDGDIVFLKDPTKDIVLWDSCDHELVIQNDKLLNEDHSNLCTGYMWIKSSNKMARLYDVGSIEGQLQYDKCRLDNNDQSYVNKYVKPYCYVRVLQLNKYPNGRVFYNDIMINQSATLVHFNWLKGHEKMAKMKECKMWLLIEDEEDVI
jgi:hypothetical protein